MNVNSWDNPKATLATVWWLLATNKRLRPLAALGMILLLGIMLRFYGLTTTTIDQIETYTPGLQFPEASGFPPRLSIRDTFIGVIDEEEPHPPGYYFMMLGWTRLFGTGILALRLPAVLFGVGSIILIYVLGELEQGTWTAVLVAGMLALNGYHIYWSRIAKMYSMGCFLGLLATVLLLLSSKPGARQRLFQMLYIGAILAGLATVVYFWFLFIAHILWVIWGTLTNKTAKPGLLRLQVLVSILASPILALAVFQSRRPSYLNPNPLPGLLRFLQFGSLFEPDNYDVPAITIPVATGVLVLLLALVLVAYGLLAQRRKLENEGTDTLEPSSILVAVAAMLSSVLILRLAKFTNGIDPARTKLVLVCSLVPPLLFVLDFLLHRNWGRIREVTFRNLALERLPFPSSVSALFAILPVTMITGVSFFSPLLAARTVLLFTPYLLIVISAGLVALVRRAKFSLVLLPILAVIFWSSVAWNEYHQYEQAPDFKSLAEKWIPEIGDSDLIFIQPSYETNPIFYYLQGNRYHFVGDKYSVEIRQHPGERVWVLSSWGVPVSRAMQDALNGYQVLETLSALRVQAVLYGPGREANGADTNPSTIASTSAALFHLGGAPCGLTAVPSRWNCSD